MQTFSEELADADVAVIARLLKPALPPDPKPNDDEPYGTIDPETGEATFVIEKVIKGEDAMVGVAQIEAIYFGEVDFDKQFLVRGIDQGAGGGFDWAIPLAMSPLAVEYVQQLQALPESGADRLAFFQPYLEHEDRQLAQDAYDEFARAAYQDLKDLKPRIDHQRVIKMINDPLISANRRRLFFTMLGVSGTEADIPMLEAMIKADDRVLVPAAEAATGLSMVAGGPLASALSVEVVQQAERRRKNGLDALIGCYLTLKGDDGLDLIDERFLTDPEADQTHIYSALMSLRISAEEGGVVSRERLLKSARLLLDNDLFADQVIPDLARWEDWSVIDKLGEMFVNAEPGTASEYVLEPIVTYLDVATEQGGEVADEANAMIAKLEPEHRDVFKRARSLQQFGFLARARPVKRQPEVTVDVTGAGEDNFKVEVNITDPGDSLSAGSSSSDMPPDPATFGAATAPPAGQAADPSAPTPESPEPRAAAKPVIPAAAEPLRPPNRALLLGAPLLGAAACFGLFWLILRSGAA